MRDNQNDMGSWIRQCSHREQSNEFRIIFYSFTLVCFYFLLFFSYFFFVYVKFTMYTHYIQTQNKYIPIFFFYFY